MERVTDLMDFNYQRRVSNKDAQSDLIKIILGISKASIADGLFSIMGPIIKRELPFDTKKYPGLSNLETFLDAMTRVIQESRVGSTMLDIRGTSDLDSINEEVINRTR
ncbi:MAG: hypothetical protein HFI86_02845 [Bacilli bacterium]|nr:hypothetical protein [Bacilli bacterium]